MPGGRCRQRLGTRTCYRKAILKDLCWQHCRLQYDWAALRIQRHYRGKKARRLLRRIFVRIPLDLQRHVLMFIREAHYIQQNHHRPIRNIVLRYIRTLPFMILTGASPSYISHVIHLARKYARIVTVDRCLRAYLLE